MKNALIGPLACFVCALGGYYVADSLWSDAPPPSVAPVTTSPGLGDSSSDALERVQRTVDELSRRLTSLETRGALETANRRPADGSNEAAAAELASLRDLLAAFESVEQAPPARFQDMVGLAIEAREERERAEREARRATQREDRMDRTMEDLATKLGLDPTQTSQLRGVLTDRDVEREEFFRSMRDGGLVGMDRGAMRDELKVRADAYTVKIQTILSPQQFEQYEGMNVGRSSAVLGRLSGNAGGAGRGSTRGDV